MKDNLPKKEGKTLKGPGRPKGSQNKLTVDIKTMVLAALDKAGGEKYLLQQAENNPTAFMALLGKILPTQITGADGKDLIQSVTVSFIKPNK